MRLPNNITTLVTRYFSGSTALWLRPFAWGILLMFISVSAKTQAPIINSFSPTIAGQSVQVNIKGKNFATASEVTFGGEVASFFYASSDTSIVAYVGSGASGAVRITNTSGTASRPGFTFVLPPVIAALIPSAGGFGDTVLIKGNHFIGVSNVYIGDSAVTGFTVLSDSLIRIVVGNGNAELITVSTIGGDGFITGFNHAGPLIHSFTPTRGTEGTIVAIRGIHFNAATVVSFGGFTAAAFIVSGDTLITATVGAGGPGAVLVKTSKGTHAVPGFILPTITSFDPQYGTKTDTVRLMGKNFTGTTQVIFGDSAAASFQVVSDSVITAVLGNGGSGAIKINTRGFTASTLYFVYLPFRPAVHSFSPVVAESGVVVTIQGKYFTGSESVRFGNLPATSFSVLSDSVISAVVSNGNTGFVAVTNSGVTDSLAGFTYLIQKPVINNFSPGSGAIGTNVTITGTGFSPIIGNNTVYFGAVRALITAATTSTLSVIVPAAATYLPITVTKNGMTGWSANPFQVTFGGAMGFFSNYSFDPQLKLSTPGNMPQRITAGDFNGDGKTDLAIANGAAGTSNNTVAVYRNTGSNGLISFAAPVQYNLGAAQGNGFDITSADINGDGKLDLVSMSNSDNQVSVLTNTSTNNMISFAPRINMTIGLSTGGGATNPINIAIADFDQDGRADIAAANYSAVNPCKVTWLKNLTVDTGIPIFSSRTDLAVTNAFGVYAADLNGDKKYDLAVGIDVNGSGMKQVALLNNNSSSGISFQPNADAGATNTLKPFDIAFADLDADGRQDMVAANGNANTISVFRNTSSAAGAISFAVQEDIVIGSSVKGVSIADLDGDGKPDIAATSADSNWVAVLKNSSIPGSISFAAKVNFTTGKTPQRVLCADLDNDGKPEIIVANQGDSSISIIKNNTGYALKLCAASGNATITANLSGTVYQWQISSNNGNSFVNINNGANYSGVTTRTLQLINLPASSNGNLYRCIVNGTVSNQQTIQFINFWTGAVNTAWANAGNWSCGVVPDLYTDVVIKSGTAILYANGICRSIKVLPGGSCIVTAAAELTIAH